MKTAITENTTTQHPQLGPPQIGKFWGWFGTTAFKGMGWRVEGYIPDVPKFVGIFAHHTSNWDFVIMLMMAYSLGIKPNFIAKDALFKPPIGWLARALGGIPVDRSRRQNMVELSAEQIRERPQIALGITPEATRSKVDFWKSGFYHMARLGQAPILMIAADYPRKVIVIAEPFMASGDIDADLEKIRAFYAPIRAKFPAQAGAIRFRERVS